MTRYIIQDVTLFNEARGYGHLSESGERAFRRHKIPRYARILTRDEVERKFQAWVKPEMLERILDKMFGVDSRGQRRHINWSIRTPEPLPLPEGWKMTKNFVDSVRFTVESLVPRHLISAETRAKMAVFAQAKLSDEDKKAAEAEIEASLSDEAKEAFAGFGAKLPFDAIEVKLKLADFLFVLYDAGSVRPSAPLAQHAHNARLQKLALRLQKDDFLLTADEAKVIKTVLETDDKWKGVQFPAYVEVKKEGEESPTLVGVALTTDGVYFYNKILNACVEMFAEKENVEEKSEAAS